MHQTYMKLALEQAKLAYAAGEVPIGAVLVQDNTVISQAYNQTITLNDPSAHAEILCIRAACDTLKNHRLLNTTLYITLEPCIMCYGAIIQARIPHIVFGASDIKNGVFTQQRLPKKLSLNHSPQFTDHILHQDCQAILNQFFQQKR